MSGLLTTQPLSMMALRAWPSTTALPPFPHYWKDIKAIVEKQDGPWPPPVFTHGDLNPTNILVRGDQVVGIIDWEFAGWYPCYWEYTSAWQAHYTRQGWEKSILKFLDSHPKALEMEITRQIWWGD
jgi:thiamine kinase-like enzyme